MADNDKVPAFKVRTRDYANRIIQMYLALPKNELSQLLGKQVLRSGTSVGAHYREACRARSTAEFVSKLSVALQELEESDYWLELYRHQRGFPGSTPGAVARRNKTVNRYADRVIKNNQGTC